MELREALRTTCAVREFDGSAVDRATIYDLLETARFAPSGGNRQGWRVVLVDDPDTKRALRDLYLSGWYEYVAIARAGLVPFSPVTDRTREDAARAEASSVAAAGAAAPGFAERLDEVPVLLVLLADLRALAAIDRDEEGYTFVGGASLYPFAWSILLAAHDVGLGGVLTTMARRRQADVLELLHVTDATLAVAGVLALGRPSTRATRLRRRAVEAFTTIDAIDGPPLTR
jgi:nitroreductase